MSNLETHMQEQDAITALCEAGLCRHAECNTTEYAFDVKMFATIRVRASSQGEALKMLRQALDCASANLGAWDNGDPILCEASLDGDPDLIEIDGEAV